MKNLVPDYLRIERIRNYILSDFTKYQQSPLIYGSMLRDDFYNVIYALSAIPTGYSTIESRQGKKVKDHLNAPRRMCDMLLWKPELLYDVDKFNEVVYYSRRTINVSATQNIAVKQGTDGTIKDLSITAYNTLTTLWWQDTKGYIKNFPAEDLIYPLLTEYEKTII